jgi:putative endonuclease
MHYVYLLQSETNRSERYVGATADFGKRLADHNSGKSPITAKHLPWRLVTYVSLSNRRKADDFERYLKSGSGHAFARRHLR